MAQKMYNQAMLYPALSGIIPLATSNWRHEQPHTQLFYGNSYTAPTPYELILQQLGLAISNAIALHIRDAKQGSLSPPAEPFGKELQPNTTRPAGGRIVRPPPGLTHASKDLNTDLDITPPRQLSPVTFDDTDTTPTTLSDLDLSFFARNSLPQRYRTNFNDAACLWNNNVPTSLSSFSDYTNPHTHHCAGATTSHRPPHPAPPLLPPEFGTGPFLT